MNRIYELKGGSYLKLNSNKITEKPVIDLLDPKALYIIQNSFENVSLASSDVIKKLEEEASQVGNFRFNKRLGLVTYSLASGMADWYCSRVRIMEWTFLSLDCGLKHWQKVL